MAMDNVTNETKAERAAGTKSAAVVADAAAKVAEVAVVAAEDVKAAVAAPVKAATRAARAVTAKTIGTVAAQPPVPINQAAETVVSAIPAIATPAKKELTSMATTFETPNPLSDMNDRAKAAVEKTQKFASEFGDFNKGNVEAIVESTRIAAKGLEALGQDTADYTRRSFEGMTATLKSLATVKSPTEFLKLQSDYMRTSFDSAVAQTSKSTEAMIKLAGDAAQPLSSRFALAAEKVKAAA